MKARKQRMLLITCVLAGVVISAAFALRAFQQNLSYFFSPSEVAAGKAPSNHSFRLGGMVVNGSVSRIPGSLTVHFVVTDFAHSVPVSYTGVLPDLFKEGSGVVARGRLDASGHFTAEEVLAKHDENYMPPNVADALKKGRAEAAGAAKGAGETTTSNRAAPPAAAGGTAITTAATALETNNKAAEVRR
jgi:cytochrome c-type biogenesis protein CcmE